MTKEEREQEIARVVALLPQQPENRMDVVNLLEERRLLKGHVIVYKCGSYYDPLEDRRKQAVRCCCSACGGTWWTSKMSAGPTEGLRRSLRSIGFENLEGPVYNGEVTLCPDCGAEVQAVHVSAFGGSPDRSIDSTSFLTVYEVAGHLVILDWFAMRRTNKDAEIFTEIHGYEGAVIIDGVYYRVSGHKRNIGGGDVWFPWERRKGQVHDLTEACKMRSMIPFDDALIARTDSDKSGFEAYCRAPFEDDIILPCSYMQLWCRFPAVENLVRTGNTLFVTGLIVASQTRSWQGYSTYEYFVPGNTCMYADWKKMKPHEILHLNKAEYKMLTGKPFEVVNYYQSIKDDYGVRLSSELLQKAEAVGVMKCREITKDKTHHGRSVSPVRVINYCDKQRKAAQGTTRTFYPRDLLDHWRMLWEYYGELPVSMMFPADFHAQHTRVSLMITERKDRELSEKIKRATEQARRYAWRDDQTGLLIEPASTAEELRAEGMALSHCVASYAKRVARGETTIFFIRQISEPEKPFFTLEYRDGAVIQNRGFENCDRTEQVQAFEARWLAHIEELNKKEKKKERKQNGKSDATRKRGHAAA